MASSGEFRTPSTSARRLAILQEIGLLKETAREVQRVQDRALGAIYRTIREVNERVATFASELMTRAAPLGLLAGVPHGKSAACIAALRQAGYRSACVIGRVTGTGEGHIRLATGKLPAPA